MVQPSSTSPSEPCRGLMSRWPWALTLALAILAGIEFVIRQVDPLKLMVYEDSDQKVSFLRMVQQNLDAPDIAFFGNSKVLHNLSAPVLRDELADRTGQRLVVRNYAVCGMLAEQLDAATAYMLKCNRSPKVTIIGLSPFMFWTDPGHVFGIENRGHDYSDPYSRHSAVMWDIPEFLRVGDDFGQDIERFFGDVIRNEVGNSYQTFRYRAYPLEAVRQFKRALLGGAKPLPNPMLGEKWRDHVESPDEDATYELPWPMIDSAGRYFDDRKAKLFLRMLDRFRERGMSVVMVEMPDRPEFRERIPDRAFDEFRSLMHLVGSEYPYTFLTLDDLGLDYAADEWRDMLHLKYRGAYRTSRVVASQLPIEAILPQRDDYLFEPDRKPK